MKLNQLTDNQGARKARLRPGRGIGSGLGKTGGRGVKGQTSRSGVSINGFEGGQMPIHRRLPKRGFNNPTAKEYAVLNLVTIQKAIDSGKIAAGADLNYDVLVASGMIEKAPNGVRLLAKGALSAKISVTCAGASAAAVAAVEAAGGSVTILPKTGKKALAKPGKRIARKQDLTAKALARAGKA